MLNRETFMKAVISSALAAAGEVAGIVTVTTDESVPVPADAGVVTLIGEMAMTILSPFAVSCLLPAGAHAAITTAPAVAQESSPLEDENLVVSEQHAGISRSPPVPTGLRRGPAAARRGAVAVARRLGQLPGMEHEAHPYLHQAAASHSPCSR